MLTDTTTFSKETATRPQQWLMPFALLLMAEASRWFSVGDVAISAIWPVTAWLCIGWMTGQRGLFAIQVLALALWSFFSQQYSLQVSVGLAISTAAGACLAGWGLSLHKRLASKGASSVRQLSLFYAVAVLAASALVALGGSWSMLQLPAINQTYQWLDIWLAYWAFEALGMLLFLPLLLALVLQRTTFLHQLQSDFYPLSMRIWGALFVALVALTVGFELLQNPTYASLAILVYFPLLFWFFLRASPSSSTLLIALLVIGLIVALLRGWAGLTAIGNVRDLLEAIALAIVVTLASQLVNVIAQERNRLLQHFRRQSVTDSLTELGNGRALRQHLEQRLKRKQQGMLLYIRMMDIGPMTDLFGLQALQQLQQELALGLQQQLPEHSQTFRLQEGDFAALLPSADHNRDALLSQLRQLQLRLEQQSFNIEQQPLRLRLAFALIAIDGQLDSASQYQQAAAQVAYLASQQPRRWYMLADSAELVAQQHSNAQIFHRLRQALRDNRLLLFAQPIRPLAHTSQGHYFEVLLRLAGDEGQIISPGAFLPVAEQSGLMVDIDRWVIDQTLQQLPAEQVACCSINLSGASLSADDTLSFIRLRLQQCLLRPQQLRFEITETENITDTETATQLIKGLRKLGCSIALDDFGTGLASFAYLKQFDFDCIKIDGQFIRDIRGNLSDQAIVRSICQVARQQELTVVAEFVEDELSIPLLKELGVDFLQGYAIGRPKPLISWLADG